MTLVEAFEHVIRLAQQSAKTEKDLLALHTVREAIECYDLGDEDDDEEGVDHGTLE